MSRSSLLMKHQHYKISDRKGKYNTLLVEFSMLYPAHTDGRRCFCLGSSAPMSTPPGKESSIHKGSREATDLCWEVSATSTLKDPWPWKDDEEEEHTDVLYVEGKKQRNGSRGPMRKMLEDECLWDMGCLESRELIPNYRCATKWPIRRGRKTNSMKESAWELCDKCT
jgi:hypothetical protein